MIGKARAQKILFVVGMTFIANLLVALGKMAVGLSLGLMALTASGFESLLDASNNVVGYVAVKLSAREADKKHPYGHRKFETFVALIVAFMMFIAGTQIFIEGVQRIKGGSIPQVSGIAFVAIITSMIVSLSVSLVEWRCGKLYQSEFLLADAAHTLTDFFSSFIVLTSLALVSIGIIWADFVAAMVVVIIILLIGFRIIREAFTILVDTSQIDPELLADCCYTVQGVKGVHKIRSRGTPDAVKVDLHIKVERNLSVETAHDLSHRVKQKIMKDFPEVDDVIVHIEPWHEQ